MKHYITHTSNGTDVYVNLIGSAAAERISRSPYLLVLVKELLSGKSIAGTTYSMEWDMGRTIGNSYVVETDAKDTIVYAQRLRDNVYTRFAKNARPKPTQYLTVILKKDDEGRYELVNTWVGRLSPPRPGSDDETKDSRPYWDTHAFVYEDEPLQHRTVTKECPY